MRQARRNLTIWRFRTQFRKEANAADNKGATVAVDSLINYEAVKVCTAANPPAVSSHGADRIDPVTSLQQRKV